MNTITVKTIEKFVSFANQRPGLEYANYGEPTSYRQEGREITKDLHDFRELLTLAYRRIENLDNAIEMYLKNSSNRLTLNAKGELEYCTGQYFPTEYRPAANRVLSNLIWASYRDEIEHNTPNNVYKNGNEIRAAIKRQVSRRVMKNYFN